MTRWARRLRRTRPSGLLGWRLFWPGRDAARRLHRQLWWYGGAGQPRALWVMAELWFWLRWQGWSAARACRASLRQHGPDLAAQGLALAEQRRRLRRLARRWCIAPEDAYRFGLITRPGRALDYVHGCESLGFHRWRNRQRPKGQGAALLQDKLALAGRAKEAGLPVVPDSRLLPRRAAIGPAEALGTAPALFCKPRCGAGGRGALALSAGVQGVDAQRLDGTLLQGPDLLAEWRGLLRAGDLLLQPLLRNHPALNLPAQAPLAVLRCLTEWRAAGPVVVLALLERPDWQDDRQRWLWQFAAMDGGAEGPVLAGIQAQRCLEQSCLAHRLVPDLYAVAWDWGLTDQGPLLLEGNAGWSTAVPQLWLGPFLQAGDDQAGG